MDLKAQHLSAQKLLLKVPGSEAGAEALILGAGLFRGGSAIPARFPVTFAYPSGPPGPPHEGGSRLVGPEGQGSCHPIRREFHRGRGPRPRPSGLCHLDKSAPGGWW